MASSPIGSQDVRPCTEQTGSAYWQCGAALLVNGTNTTEPEPEEYEGTRFGLTDNSRLEYKKLDRTFRRR